MADVLNEREFSRKSFVKGGGALIVGFSLAGAVGKAAKAVAPVKGPTPTPAGYLPDTTQVDAWLTVNSDNTITLKTSKIEVGNGITTGLLEVAAEELDMDMSDMRYGWSPYVGGAPASTLVDSWVAVNTGGEGGSNAMSGTGPMVRSAAVTARAALLSLAATNLGVPAAQLTVSKGVVSGGGKTVTYGQLVNGQLLNAKIVTAGLNPGVAPAKPIANYSMVTKRDTVFRIDVPDKVNATYTYVHNVRVPGMVHGRLVRPRGQGAYPYNSNVPVSIDANSISHIPGAQIVHVNNFVGVVAPKEYDAIQAAAQLKVVWNENPILPGTGNLWKNYRAVDSAGNIPAKVTTQVGGDVDAAMKTATHTVSGTFTHHYQGHMPIGPSCCIADVRSDGATIWSNTQNVPNLVTDLMNVLAPLTAPQIRVLFYEGSASYGNGMVAFDTAESAAIMSKAIGKPVRLQMMRWDEHGWTHYGPASMIDARAGIDANGNIVAYDLTQFTQGGTSLYTGRELLGNGPGSPNAAANALPQSVPGGTVNTENPSPWMKIAKTGPYRLISKPINSQYGIFHSGALRAPGAQQMTIADAQIMDMLAVAANMDPLAFRLQNLSTDLDGQRWAAVLQAAADSANWQAKVSGSNLSKANIVRGRGIANSHHGGAYAAVVADVEVNKKTGKMTVLHVYGAQDAGLTVNPNLVENQMMGSMIQGVSRAMWEEVTFDKNNVTSTDWVTYPILRFKDSPDATMTIVQRLDQPSLGSGEPPTCPIVGCLANAFYDATGVRLHEAPYTPGRVRATLRAAGIS